MSYAPLKQVKISYVSGKHVVTVKDHKGIIPKETRTFNYRSDAEDHVHQKYGVYEEKPKSATHFLMKEEAELTESKMKELYGELQNHLDKHISTYKKMGGAEALGDHVVSVKKKLGAKYGEGVHHHIDQYVDSKLSEETELDEGAKIPYERKFNGKIFTKTGKVGKHIKTGETTHEYKYSDKDTDERAWFNRSGKYLGEETINEEKHRCFVSVSDPNHTAASKRSEKVYKVVKMSGDKESAVDRAKAFYKKQGYKIHDAGYLNTISESNMDWNAYAKHMAAKNKPAIAAAKAEEKEKKTSLQKALNARRTPAPKQIDTSDSKLHKALEKHLGGSFEHFESNPSHTTIKDSAGKSHAAVRLHVTHSYTHKDLGMNPGEMEDTSETHKVTAIRKDGKYNIVHGHSVASIREETDLDEKYIGFEKLAGKVGPRLAAFIGRKKYGAKGMTDSKAKHKAEDKKMHEESIPFDGSRPAKALANKFIKTKEWYGDEEKMMKNTKAGVVKESVEDMIKGLLEDYMEEGYTVDHTSYEMSHGKKAKGRGNWTIGINYKTLPEKTSEGITHITHNGSLTDALKKAKEAHRKNSADPSKPQYATLYPLP